jgi:Pyruvate/2-oxoacid:ferredoxin oxidoreductase delta subunit
MILSRCPLNKRGFISRTTGTTRLHGNRSKKSRCFQLEGRSAFGDAGPMARRIIEVNQELIGPPPQPPRTLRQKRFSDYPAVSPAHREIAKKLARTTLVGPPVCDELLALVQHLFTEPEAEIVRLLGHWFGRTALQVSRAARKPLEEVEPILRTLAVGKRAIAASGPENKSKYKLMPLMPGVFEMVLISENPETISPWHRRFAELFETLYATGYLADYGARPSPFVRFLPINQLAKAHPAALPCEQLEIVVDRYKSFAIGQCQCRTTMSVTGQGCGKPIGNCCAMGDFAEQGIRTGSLRRVTKKDLMDLKAEGEAHGMVSWILNVESAKGQFSCTCCGCCCHAMRVMSEFNAPSLAAPPHFLPQIDEAKCSYCGKCARNCPMGAIVVGPKSKTWQHLLGRCIGCGLCSAACNSRHALSMTPVPDYRLPPNSWFALIARTAPSHVRNTLEAWRRRRSIG